MALTKCWECQREISSFAAACPHCGAPPASARTASATAAPAAPAPATPQPVAGGDSKDTTREPALPGGGIGDEHAAFQTRLHYVNFVSHWAGIVITALLAVVVFAAFPAGARWIGGGLLGIAAMIWLAMTIEVRTSRFVVTDKRVVINLGWLNRRSYELLLSKVEGITVDQSLVGRMLGFGSIAITGTGGTVESFKNIAAPLEFRRHVQEQIERGRK